ncbi:hypothetical protein RM52_00720 [Microbacterium hominis]|uniref:Uncharacterized protein n=2 Tax=Microbacterium hominis TaxID=162426 RepID=A0A0B4E096_9MICO|nr:hypothetical protein [Microbacterium hominis]KIC59973.1 hypothetical protein RM52_00720 [Microbacterium hominis]
MTMRADQEQSPNGGDCPPWCVTDHESQEHPEDQWHESTIIGVAVVECWSYFVDDTWRLDVNGLELNVLLEQHTTSSTPWIMFGPGEDRERGFRLSPESIRQLMTAFDAVLKLITQ